MKFLNLTKLVSGKYPSDDKGQESPITISTKDDIVTFMSVLGTKTEIHENFKLCRMFDEFVQVYPIFTEYMDLAVAEDCFYAVKMGSTYANVPSKLVYILIQAKAVYPTPNKALSVINHKYIQKFLKKGALAEGLTIETVMSNVFGYKVDLLHDFNPCAKVNDSTFEVLIPDVDEVAVIAKDMADLIQTEEDAKHLSYSKKQGVLFNNQPLRILNGRLGVTRDDFILVEVF